MWPTSSRLGYGEMGMFVVAPATSFHHPSSDPLIPDAAAVAAAQGGAATALGVGVGVIPLLTATPCLNVSGGMDGGDDLMNSRTRASAIHLWQQTQQQQQQLANSHYQNKSTSGSKSINFEAAGMFSGGGGGTTTCQDCGNQAKKDCSHRRCRTCCRSRGFECSTHVKSTWVPAARRRERHMMTVAGTSAGGGGGGGGASSGSTSGAKKPRLISSQNTTATTSHTSASNTPPRSFDTSSSHQDAGLKETLPGQVRAPAVFKCVRVTAVEEGDDEYAYQAVVKIGGHVFKGILYDQGAEQRESLPNLSELHLGGGASSSGGGRNNGGSSSSPLLDPPDVYGTAGGTGALLGGSSYGNTMN